MGSSISKDELDKTYQPKGTYITKKDISGKFQPAGNYVTTDMLSQQINSVIQQRQYARFRDLSFTRISPNVALISPVTHGVSDGPAYLPYCVPINRDTPNSFPIFGVYGTPSFIDKVMVYKESSSDVSSPFGKALIQAMLTLNKEEGFRYRRQEQVATAVQDVAVPLSSYSPINKQLLALDRQLRETVQPAISSLSEEEKRSFSSFVSKHGFVIQDFDDATGRPILKNESGGIPYDSEMYQKVVGDILRFNPTMLRPCPVQPL